MKFNVHAGHNKYSTGASSVLNENNEARSVKNELIRLLKEKGHTVYDCTDEVGKSTDDNLYNIVVKCNLHTVDLDVSIHLNCGRGDTKGDGDGYTGGVEVWVYDTSSKAYETAKRVCEKISKELNVTNRGVKISKEFYVLRNTINPAMLIECAFVDDVDDKEQWNATKCAKAIYEGLTNTIWKEEKYENTEVVKYIASDSKVYYMNVYKADKLEKLSVNGYTNYQLTIGTEGARNCFDSWDKNKKIATGNKKGTKPKGTKLLVRKVSGGNL